MIRRWGGIRTCEADWCERVSIETGGGLSVRVGGAAKVAVRKGCAVASDVWRIAV